MCGEGRWVDVRGSMPLTARVMVSVVMSALSAAGSRMLPSTECMLNRLAKNPSACVSHQTSFSFHARTFAVLVGTNARKGVTHEI